MTALTRGGVLGDAQRAPGLPDISFGGLLAAALPPRAAHKDKFLEGRSPSKPPCERQSHKKEKQCANPISNIAANHAARSRCARIYRAMRGVIHPARRATRSRSSAIAPEQTRSTAYFSCSRSTEVSPNRVRLTRLTACSRNICRWISLAH